MWNNSQEYCWFLDFSEGFLVNLWWRIGCGCLWCERSYVHSVPSTKMVQNRLWVEYKTTVDIFSPTHPPTSWHKKAYKSCDSNISPGIRRFSSLPESNRSSSSFHFSPFLFLRFSLVAFHRSETLPFQRSIQCLARYLRKIWMDGKIMRGLKILLIVTTLADFKFPSWKRLNDKHVPFIYSWTYPPYPSHVIIFNSWGLFLVLCRWKLCQGTKNGEKNVLDSTKVCAFQSCQCCLSHPQTFSVHLEGIKSSTFFSMEKINRYISNTEKGSPLIQCSFCVCVHFCVGSSTANIIILPTFLWNADWEWWRHFSFFSPFFSFTHYVVASPQDSTSFLLSTLKKLSLESGFSFSSLPLLNSFLIPLWGNDMHRSRA